MTVAVVNVGPGAALDIDVRMVYEPANAGAQCEERRWRQNVLTTGERRDFLPPGDLNDNLNTLTAAYQAIHDEGRRATQAGGGAKSAGSKPPLHVESYYYVCDLCGHFWSQEEPPSRCERCWSNLTWLIRMSTVEAAERRSERTRSDDRQGKYLHARTH